jgi:hypothetical protein
MPEDPPMTTVDALAWMAVLFAVFGTVWGLSLLPGCGWLLAYGRFTLPLPSVLASWAFLVFRGWWHNRSKPVQEIQAAPPPVKGD